VRNLASILDFSRLLGAIWFRTKATYLKSKGCTGSTEPTKIWFRVWSRDIRCTANVQVQSLMVKTTARRNVSPVKTL